MLKYLIGQFSVYRGIFVRVTLYFGEPLDKYNTRDEYKYFLFKYNYGKEKTGHEVQEIHEMCKSQKEAWIDRAEKNDKTRLHSAKFETSLPNFHLYARIKLGNLN